MTGRSIPSAGTRTRVATRPVGPDAVPPEPLSAPEPPPEGRRPRSHRHRSRRPRSRRPRSRRHRGAAARGAAARGAAGRGAAARGATGREAAAARGHRQPPRGEPARGAAARGAAAREEPPAAAAVPLVSRVRPAAAAVDGSAARAAGTIMQPDRVRRRGAVRGGRGVGEATVSTGRACDRRGRASPHPAHLALRGRLGAGRRPGAPASGEGQAEQEREGSVTRTAHAPILAGARRARSTRRAAPGRWALQVR